MSAVIPLRAAPSELQRSSPRPPLSASGPVTDIQPGHWRTLIARLRSGFLYLREAAAKVRGVRFCDEHRAQAMTLRHRGPGLPHHRHPMTAHEALAGLALMLVGLPCLAYILWRVL